MPRYDPPVVRRLREHLVVPKSQAVNAEKVGAQLGDALVRDQFAQGLVHAKTTEEVTHHFVWPIREGLLDFVKTIAVTVEVLHNLGDCSTHLFYFAIRQNIHRPNETISGKALTQRIHRTESTRHRIVRRNGSVRRRE